MCACVHVWADVHVERVGRDHVCSPDPYKKTKPELLKLSIPSRVAQIVKVPGIM